MSDTKQTAVDWLINEIESKGDAWENASIRRVMISIDVSDYLEIKRKAFAMEREQIESAYSQAHEDGRESTLNDRNYDAFYYERIYGNK